MQLLLLGAIVFMQSCNSDDTAESDDTDVIDDPSDAVSTPLSAFDEFNPDAVTISFDGTVITIESNGLPNHTSPYWPDDNPLHINKVANNPDAQTPGLIGERGGVIHVAIPGVLKFLIWQMAG